MKKTNFLNKIIGAVGLTILSGQISAQQTYVNKEWDVYSGNPGQYDYVSTALDPNGNLISISNNQPNGNSNIFLNCICPIGNVLWQENCTSLPLVEDYGVDVKVDNFGNSYTCGAKHNGNNYDYYIAKYSQTGVLIWDYQYNGIGNSDDAPSALVLDANYNVYVTGSSYGTNTYTDFATLKIDGANGALIWESRYNFNNKPEVATDIKIDGTGNVLVCGASAQNFFNSDFAVVKYNGSNGNQIAVKRHNSPGNGYDLPSEMVIDANNFIYVLGTSNSNLPNKDIKLIAYDPSLQIQWTEYIDKSGGSDEGYGITLDSNGDLIITGYCTKSSGGTDCVTAKYAPSTGNQIWINEKTALVDTQTSKGRKVKTDSNGNIYVTSEADINGTRDLVTFSYDSNGQLRWEKSFNNPSNGSDNASKILVNNESIFVTGKSNDGGIDNTVTIKYATKEKPLDPVTDINGNQYVDNELLIRFDTSAVIKDVIDKKDFTFGILSDFVKPNVLNELELKTGFSWKSLSTFKIFLRMTTADSISITRLGDTIRLDDFWATLSVYIPVEYNEQQIADSISTLFPLIQYAERDFFSEFHSAPNDALYSSEMIGLYNPLNGIEVESAWDKQVGQTYTKVGVFDTGINWRHEDYGDGTSSGTKVVGGWDYYNNVSPFSQVEPDLDGHGTATSGLIGALRNNNIGISGVAGGDVQAGNTGCQLFSMAIPISGQVSHSTLHSIAAPAIVEGASYNPSTGYGYGLHIQNHSWGTPTNTNVLKEAVKSCYQNNCIFVASSGNDGNATINYPATYKDEWVLKVGANDGTGDRASFSTYGNDLDVLAPGTNDLYMVLDNTNNSGYIDLVEDVDIYGNPVFLDINGTSFAAPLASGACALLYSEHNTNNGYPNNLAPEDMEAFINSFKTDVPPAGYDQETGHGRINTNYALEKLMLPQYFVKHSGGQNNTTAIPSYNNQVIVANNINGVAAGSYWADRYQVTNTFLDIFAPTQTVISHWPRNSSSVGVSAANPITGDTYFSYTPTISQNVASVTTTTFCWFITTSTNSQTVNKWIPAAPSQLRTAYSLYVKDNAVTGIDEAELESGFNIYPNPSNSQITIDYYLLTETDSEVAIYDATGKLIAQHTLENQNSGNQSVTINISHLADGLYLCNLKVGDQIVSKRIVKN
ncbi:MAG: T9SS C-terminal target domain-containing protein [Flavobacteriia bacterium]|nr:T9SS C-terminal target domain-containing protein [Flavobacteriia bacterium]